MLCLLTYPSTQLQLHHPVATSSQLLLPGRLEVIRSSSHQARKAHKRGLLLVMGGRIPSTGREGVLRPLRSYQTNPGILNCKTDESSQAVSLSPRAGQLLHHTPAWQLDCKTEHAPKLHMPRSNDNIAIALSLSHSKLWKQGLEPVVPFLGPGTVPST